MVTWQMEGGADEYSSFEEMNSTVSVLSSFSWSFSHPVLCVCQICRFGERSWCGRNVLDYMICAVECHRQRICTDNG